MSKRKSYLITGGSLIDGTGASPRDASVLVVDDRIKAVGSAADEEVSHSPPGTVVHIDAAGGTLIPGLVDAHVHITYGDGNSREELYFYTTPQYGALRAAYNAKKVLRAGVTSISDPISSANIGVALRDAIRAGLTEGPRLVTAGRALSTANASGFPNHLARPEGFANGIAISSKDEAVREIRNQVNDGVDLIKIMASCESTSGNSYDTREFQTFTFPELNTMVEEAHRLGRKVAAHARSGPAAVDVARAGVDWLFHGSFMTEEHLEAVRETGTTICPTLTYLANAADFGPAFGGSQVFSDFCKRELDIASEILTTARKMGVPMMIGSEAGFSITPYGEWHARELELFVTLLGFTPLETIAIATGSNAKMLDLSETGTIETGKLADLLVVDGDPLKDIRVLQDKSRFKMIMKGGRLVDLDAELPEPRRWPSERVNFWATERVTREAVGKAIGQPSKAPQLATDHI